MILGALNVDIFLKEYWQKKPVVIRNAFPAFEDPITPEELAGLACEVEVESRMVFNKEKSWNLKPGPFLENDFTSLPEQDWTLLVQAVDTWFPDVKQLISSIPFIPRWRIDDVMVSYAEANGGVGPHFDYYDVFIIQGKGSRIWRTGQVCDSKTEINTDSGLKILNHFEQEEEWELHSGDVIYIPPGLAHYGISQNASLSYSIGFRAPSLSEMLINYSDEICADLSEDQRFKDSDHNTSGQTSKELQPGEINSFTLGELQSLIQSSMNDPVALASWFGKYMTEAKLVDTFDIPEKLISSQELLEMSKTKKSLWKHPSARFAWIQNPDSLSIFANGEVFVYNSASELLHSLNRVLNTDDSSFNLSPFLHDPDCLEIICHLFNQGSLLAEKYL